MTPPRILILSDEGPQTGTAGGLLLHRLLAGHPADRLRVIARYVPTTGAPLPGVTYRQLNPPWMRFERSRFHRLKRSLRAHGLVPEVSARQLDELIGDFKPEVVLCVMQHAAYYDTALAYARARNLPLVVLVHDVNDEFEPVYGWARHAANQRDATFYLEAAARLCVSPEMEEYCITRFGARGAVLYPNRSEELQPRPLALAETLCSPGRLTIGFAGNLNYGYGVALCQMLPAMREAGIRLVLYSQPPGPEAAALTTAGDTCDFRGFVPSAEAWAGIQRDCDAVWLPYPNPAGAMERLYRYHFPSKLPEYLALGLPVIVSGPDYATGVRWARGRPAAVATASGRDHAELLGLFRRLAVDSAWRSQLAREGWAAGQQSFDPVMIRDQFHAHLRAVITPR